MGFRLVEREGVPDSWMSEFYDRGRKAGDFGKTVERSESDRYDTIALVLDQEVVGSANLLYHDGEAKLEGCYILPSKREELERNGKSAFEHMAGARLQRTDLPAKTYATMLHGKTQHVYNKLGFSPYEFELPESDDGPAHVMMADCHSRRRFDHEIYVPESVAGFIDYVAKEFGQEPSLREGDYDGVKVECMEDKFEESYKYFKVREGFQNLDNAINQVLEAKEDAVNVRVDIDVGNTSAYSFISELVKEDFTSSAFKPVVKSAESSQSSVVQLAWSHKPIDAEVVPETREFLEEAGWCVEVVDRKEKSNEVRISSA